MQGRIVPAWFILVTGLVVGETSYHSISITGSPNEVGIYFLAFESQNIRIESFHSQITNVDSQMSINNAGSATI